MKLFIIQRPDDNIGWDEFEGLVVAADSIDNAIQISCDFSPEFERDKSSLDTRIISDSTDPSVKGGVVFSAFRHG